MSARSKFILTLISIFFLFILIQVILFITHTDVDRSGDSLLNQYYIKKNSDPIGAKRMLDAYLKKYPNDRHASHELGFWYLKQGHVMAAINQFEKIYKNDIADDLSGIQLSKLYISQNEIAKAKKILIHIAFMHGPYRDDAEKILKTINESSPEANASLESGANAKQLDVNTILAWFAKPITHNQTTLSPTVNQKITTKTLASNNIASQISKKIAVIASTVSQRDQMMNEFYALKRQHSPQAWEKINQVLIQYPYDIQALKEAGYYALMTIKSDAIAEPYFLRAYAITHDPQIALQIAYIYDKLGNKPKAYYYFDIAANSCDIKSRMTAEIAKSNLRGLQTKYLPYPYYAFVNYTPLYMSRFKLLIQPIILNFGLLINPEYQLRVYLSYRRTSDDKSNTSNQISSIYQDDAAITAVGIQLTPLKFIPQLILFSELGKSVDLVYRNRSRWRSDFRGGFAYYNEWGRPIEYTLQPKLMIQPNADLYGDAIYYNRYHDGIADLRFRPGAKIFRFGSTTIDLYYRLFLIEDQAREFYNNIFENGPGVAIRFSDRYNIVLRYEQIHGHYLPADSPSVNPYSKNYHNAVTELDTYFEF